MTPPLDRDALVAQALPLVQRVARQVARDLPSWVPLDDLTGAGREGLVQAALRYDASRGATFMTYAWYRIRGAILDHVRSACAEDPQYRARIAAQLAVDDLNERAPDASAASPESSPLEAATQLALLLEDAATAFTLAEIAAQTSPPPGADPEEGAMASERRALLDRAMAQLPSRERQLLATVYLHGQTVDSAAEAIGIGRSWASRLHSRALALVREALVVLEDDL